MFTKLHYWSLVIACTLPRIIPCLVARWLLVTFGMAARRKNWRQTSCCQVYWSRGKAGIVSAAWDGEFRHLQSGGSTNPIDGYLWRCVTPNEVSMAEYDAYEKRLAEEDRRMWQEWESQEPVERKGHTDERGRKDEDAWWQEQIARWT